MFLKQKTPDQQSIWIETSELPRTPANAFYQKLDELLENHGFYERVHELCEPHYYTETSVGRPGTDPVVYFKMLLVGFFEGLRSNRRIAFRCADSLSLRAFLRYAMNEDTPDHSTLSRISSRLPLEVHQQCFALVLKILADQGLFRGENLGIDASSMEANASLESLRNRLTDEKYQEYVLTLAEEAGIDITDDAAVRNFDRNRPGRKTSNKEWENPHDPDAKVGRTKRGTTRMMYKVEHTVDLDTGAIADADVRPGDEHDTEELSERVRAIDERITAAVGADHRPAGVNTITADKGYFKLQEIMALDDLGYGPVIADPHRNRRRDRLSTEASVALQRAAMRCEAPVGRQRQRNRCEFVERTFAHVLDWGGARRTTLRGLENIRKRYLIQASAANLSLLMRKLFGVGTPKQAFARLVASLQRLFDSIKPHTSDVDRYIILEVTYSAVSDITAGIVDRCRELRWSAFGALKTR